MVQLQGIYRPQIYPDTLVLWCSVYFAVVEGYLHNLYLARTGRITNDWRIVTSEGIGLICGINGINRSPFSQAIE
jgi:hypothetical protein